MHLRSLRSTSFRSGDRHACAMVIVLVVAMLFCPRTGGADSALIVGVTVPAQKFLIERLLPGQASVTVLLPSGSNHESYEPSFRQLREISAARVFFAVGHPQFGFERAWLPKLHQLAPALEIIETAPLELQRTDDIHLWLSFTGIGAMLETISLDLQKRLPAESAEIRSRANQVKLQLDSLRSALITRRGETSPPPFLSVHPSWTSLAAEIGLSQIVLEQCGKDASLHSASAVLEQAKKEGVRVFVVEPGTAKQQQLFFLNALGARAVAVDPLGDQWFDLITTFADAVLQEGASP